MTDIQSNLEFDLRVQEFIELVRTSQHLPAIMYYRKHLIPFEKTHQEHIQRAAGLLAFPPDTQVQPYKVIPLSIILIAGHVCSRSLATSRRFIRPSTSYSLLSPLSTTPPHRPLSRSLSSQNALMLFQRSPTAHELLLRHN